MIVGTATQGSIEWFAERSGVISASNFNFIRSSSRLKSGPNKGDYNEKAKSLGFKLAIERISGLALGTDDGFEVWQATRGRALEPHAKAAHERRYDLLVETAGFITTDDRKFGATADGFADRDGRRRGCEYKCYTAPDKLRDVLLFGSTDTVIDQCDGGMWITGLTGWDFGLYCPALDSIGLDFVLTPIERDDERMQGLEEDLWAFDQLVETYVTCLRQRAGLNTDPAPGCTDVVAAREVARELVRMSNDLPESIFG